MSSSSSAPDKDAAFRRALRILADAGYQRTVVLALADDAQNVLMKTTLPAALARDLVVNVAAQIGAARAGIILPK